MCNRYSIQAPERFRSAGPFGEAFSRAFGEMAPRYNIAPSQLVPVIASDENGAWHAGPMKWGFIPAYDNATAPKFAPTNAKAETVLTSGMFKHAAQQRRCLLPADGFFEWHHLTPTVKVPHYFHVPSGEPFFFAGIYEPSSEDRPATCALLTMEPLPVVAPHHNCTPLLLDESTALGWAVSGPMTIERLVELQNRPHWGKVITEHEVSRVASNPRNDSPECVLPVRSEDDLFSLGGWMRHPLIEGE